MEGLCIKVIRSRITPSFWKQNKFKVCPLMAMKIIWFFKNDFIETRDNIYIFLGKMRNTWYTSHIDLLARWLLGIVSAYTYRNFKHSLMNSPSIDPRMNLVISRFWPNCIKIVNDVDIIIKSWRVYQNQGPAINLTFYVSTIKIDAYGSCAIQE